MRILFVGDIVGKPGRRVLCQQLPRLQERLGIDFTIVNVENTAGGFGLTPRLARQVLSWGVDVMTSGNHIWDKSQILDFLDQEPRLLRPGNYPPELPGRGCTVQQTRQGISVAVLNAQGRVFMPLTDCPFRWVRREVQRLRQQTPLIILDFHAEATSEKLAMGWHLDGLVSAVVGTHTHVPTADASVLPLGTAYLTDVGMTGAYRGVIGMQAEGALQRMTTGVSARLKVATGDARLAGVTLELDPESGKALAIEPLLVRYAEGGPEASA